MYFQELSERLAALQESNSQLQALILRLRDTHFQPGSIIPGDNIVIELSTEIQQTIREQDEDLELLREEASGLDSGRPGSELEERKAGLEEVIRRAISELQKLQKDFRHAQVIAKKNSAAQQRAERELLLQTYADPHSNLSSPGPGQRRSTVRASKEISQDEKTINASSDVTLALRRTHAMMTSELSRSQFAHDTLKDSTAALARLGENYSRLDTMLSSSRNLLSTLISSQKSDTWYLETAFMVLAVTIGWLAFRRFVYGPAWWLVWLPIKLLYKTVLGVLAVVGLKSSTSDAAAHPSIQSLGLSTLNIPHGSATALNMGSQSSAVIDGEAGFDLTRTGTPNGGSGVETLSEQVGHIIENRKETHQIASEDPRGREDLTGEPGSGSGKKSISGQSSVQGTEPSQDQKNPMKRMWEEEVDGHEGIKDEL